MQNVQGAFRALADPTRRMILERLSIRDMTIGEVTENFDMTRAAIKKHLNILENGKLISVHRRGRERINRLKPVGMKSVSEWLGYFDSFWSARLKDLKNIIETDQGDKNV